MLQKATLMGNWWLAASSGLHNHSCITSHVVFFGEISNYADDSAQIWHTVTSGFSQNENQLWKGRDFRLSMNFRKVRWGSWRQLGEVCEVPRCLLWRGIIFLCRMFLVTYFLLQMSLFFILYGWIPSGHTSCLCVCVCVCVNNVLIYVPVYLFNCDTSLIW